MLTKYLISLIDVLGEIESVPIHKTILVSSFSREHPIYLEPSIDEGSIQDQFLRKLSEDPKVLEFIGEPRSVDSQIHEDVIIGTEGSLVRSEDIETLLSYHAYNRALHLFLEKYNLEIEKAWNSLKESEELVEVFEGSMTGTVDSAELGKLGLFSSDRRHNLRTTRLFVIQGIKNKNNFIVVTSFIEESIEFTIDKYSQVLESDGVKANSFHIRKVLRTLQDRAKHLKIVSENFATQGNTLVSRLDLYDSEIAFEIQQKIEKLAFIIGLIGTILAVFAILQQALF